MKDIILFVGPIAVGKTEAVRYLTDCVKQSKISVHKHARTDAQCICRIVLSDDKAGGKHHTHTWCKDTNGHLHTTHKERIPFISTDGEIPTKLRYMMFRTLNTLPKSKLLWFIEWAGGKNIYPKRHPWAQANFSYAAIVSDMKTSPRYKRWINRVRAVVHITATRDTRRSLNNKTAAFQLKSVKNGTKGWKRNSETFALFGKDDFSSSGFEHIFLTNKIPVYTIRNNGTPRFYTRLNALATTLFPRYH